MYFVRTRLVVTEALQNMSFETSALQKTSFFLIQDH